MTPLLYPFHDGADEDPIKISHSVRHKVVSGGQLVDNEFSVSSTGLRTDALPTLHQECAWEESITSESEQRLNIPNRLRI
jgi:hypothetical protein